MLCSLPLTITYILNLNRTELSFPNQRLARKNPIKTAKEELDLYLIRRRGSDICFCGGHIIIIMSDIENNNNLSYFPSEGDYSGSDGGASIHNIR